MVLAGIGARGPRDAGGGLVCAYAVRPDIGAVVHAHPPLSKAFSVAGVPLEGRALPEVVVTLGTIPTSEYATPTADEPPKVIRRLLKEHDAILLSHNGTLTVGTTLFEAYTRLEKVEHAAQVVFAAMQLGGVQALSGEQLERLARLRNNGSGRKRRHPAGERGERPGRELRREQAAKASGGTFRTSDR